jgi:lipopolysaccharide transport system permease protein
LNRESKSSEDPEAWDLVIKPQTRLFDINLREVWRYRDLLLLFVRRDFVALYKQTVLGPIWHLIQPVLTTVMFLLIFSRIAHIPTDGIAPVLFYLSGITLWNYFSSCITSTAGTFTANAVIFGKVYFPRLIIPLSVIVSNMMRLGIQLTLLLLTMIWFHFHGYPIAITFRWLWVPVIVFLMAGLSLGLGIIVSSVTTKYRDFSVLLTFVVQLGMYATPVAYPISYLQQSKYAYLIQLNPLSSLMEAFRYAMFGKGTFTFEGILYSGGAMLVVLVVGIFLFNKVEKTFVDTV